jgi:amidase
MNPVISRRNFVLCSAAIGTGILSACNSKSFTGEPWDEFVEYDSLGLAELIKSGQLSQAELTEIIIARIETHREKQSNPEFHDEPSL